MDRGSWQATVHGVTSSWTWLSKQRFHFQIGFSESGHVSQSLVFVNPSSMSGPCSQENSKITFLHKSSLFQEKFICCSLRIHESTAPRLLGICFRCLNWMVLLSEFERHLFRDYTDCFVKSECSLTYGGSTWWCKIVLVLSVEAIFWIWSFSWARMLSWCWAVSGTVSHVITRVNHRCTHLSEPRQPFCFSLSVRYSIIYMS